MQNRIVSFSVRVYAWLLHLYPVSFRREYGYEMLLVFRDQCRAAHRRSGKRGIIQVWLRTLLDVTVNAYGERLAMLRHAKTRNAFLILASGDVALLLSWIWLIWALAFATLILLDPWDFGWWVRPVGTLAGSISHFFGRTPGLFVPVALVLLLQFRRLVILWRTSSNRRSIVWVFALTNTFYGITLMGVIAWSGRLTEILFPHFFSRNIDVGYGRTFIGILIALFLLGLSFAAQSRFAAPRHAEPIPAA